MRPSLSAGRVQSVTVRLIVEREREIEAFQSESTYRIQAQFLVQDQLGKTSLLKAELNHRFETQTEAQSFLEQCQTADFTIATITKKPSKRTPAAPFTTSTLQQEAARKLGFSVARTMKVAQTLYEEGLITYMRTDSMNLSDFCLKSAAHIVEETLGTRYHKARHYHTKAKGAQEAHEAIRPTDMARSMVTRSAEEQRLYDLIWKRTLASQMADAQLEKTTVTIDISNCPYQFQAVGEVMVFDGFLRIYSESREEQHDDKKEESSSLLPPMIVGQALLCEQITAQERFNLAPPRYSEASLVSKLEELGIGRPSTYAPTISTIQNREYVRSGDSEGKTRKYQLLILHNGEITKQTKEETYGSNKGKLVPTDIGIVVNDYLCQNFHEIMDYHFTAKVEQDFDLVAEGKKKWDGMIRHFYEELEPRVEQALNERNEARVGERHLGTDPQTGRAVSVRIGRFGPMVQIGNAEDGTEEKPRFASLAAGQSITTITLDEALALFKLPITLGDFEDQIVKVNVGRFGPYVQHGKSFTSLEKGEDPHSVTLDRAIALILAKREADAKKILKTFAEEPDLQVLNGRFGAYIAYKGSNYKLQKAQREKAAELTLEECLAIVNDEGQSPKTKSRAAKPTSKRSPRKKSNDA